MSARPIDEAADDVLDLLDVLEERLLSRGDRGGWLLACEIRRRLEAVAVRIEKTAPPDDCLTCECGWRGTPDECADDAPPGQKPGFFCPLCGADLETRP